MISAAKALMGGLCVNTKEGKVLKTMLDEMGWKNGNQSKPQPMIQLHQEWKIISLHKNGLNKWTHNFIGSQKEQNKTKINFV